MRTAWLVAIALASAPMATADEPEERPRERAARVVDRYMEKQIREGLGLTDEQVGRVMPALRRLHQARRDARERRTGALQDLRQAFASGAATETEIAEMVRVLRRLEQEEMQNLLRSRDAVDDMLTPVQQGKLRLLEAALQRKVRDARRGGGQGRR